MGKNRRAHVRTPVTMTTEITFNSGVVLTVQTQNLSNGGIAVNRSEQDADHWQLGDELTVQVLGLEPPAPRVAMKVVRIGAERVGLQTLAAEP